MTLFTNHEEHKQLTEVEPHVLCEMKGERKLVSYHETKYFSKDKNDASLTHNTEQKDSNLCYKRNSVI